MIENLIGQPDTLELSEVLAETYLSAAPEISQDAQLRSKVIDRIAKAPRDEGVTNLDRFARFPIDEVAAGTNKLVGTITTSITLSEAFNWLSQNANQLDVAQQLKKLPTWRRMTPFQLCELLHLIHRFGSDENLRHVARRPDYFASPGPKFKSWQYETQAEIAIHGLDLRLREGAKS